MNHKVKVLKKTGEQHPHARLGISIGGEGHEGEKFAATINWIKRHFDHCQIVIGDTLLKHNIMFLYDLSEEEATERGVRLGNEWLERNKSSFTGDTQFDVVRWSDYVRGTPDFITRNSLMHDLYATDMFFREKIDQDILSLWERRFMATARMPGKGFDRFKSFSRNYILEELAIFSLLDEQTPHTDVYPGSFLKILTTPARREIHRLPDALKNFSLIRIDFLKKTDATLIRHSLNDNNAAA